MKKSQLHARAWASGAFGLMSGLLLIAIATAGPGLADSLTGDALAASRTARTTIAAGAPRTTVATTRAPRPATIAAPIPTADRSTASESDDRLRPSSDQELD